MYKVALRDHGKQTYPEVVLASQVDLGSSRDSSTEVRPRPVDAWCTVDGDLPSSRETVVPPIGVAPDERGIVSIVAHTTARHRVRITLDHSRKSHKGRNNSRLHLARKQYQNEQLKQKQERMLDNPKLDRL